MGIRLQLWYENLIFNFGQSAFKEFCLAMFGSWDIVPNKNIPHIYDISYFFNVFRYITIPKSILYYGWFLTWLITIDKNVISKQLFLVHPQSITGRFFKTLFGSSNREYLVSWFQIFACKWKLSSLSNAFPKCSPVRL